MFSLVCHNIYRYCKSQNKKSKSGEFQTIQCGCKWWCLKFWMMWLELVKIKIYAYLDIQIFTFFFSSFLKLSTTTTKQIERWNNSLFLFWFNHLILSIPSITSSVFVLPIIFFWKKGYYANKIWFHLKMVKQVTTIKLMFSDKRERERERRLILATYLIASLSLMSTNLDCILVWKNLLLLAWYCPYNRDNIMQIYGRFDYEASKQEQQEQQQEWTLMTAKW